MTVVVVAALAAAGCSKSKTPEGKSAPAAADQPKAAATATPGAPSDLWALAPEGTVGGAVLRPGAVARLAAAIRTVRGDYAALPGAAAALARMDQLFGEGLPMSPVDPASWDRLGLAFDQPAAIFTRGDGGLLLVVPVADRDAFVKAMAGTSDGTGAARVDHLGSRLTCKQLAGGRYACATAAEMLDAVGKGADFIAAEKTRPAALRGDIELRQSSEIPGFRGFAGAVELERGGFTARVHADVDTGAIAPFIGHDGGLAGGLKAAKPAGFVRVRVNLASLAASAPADPMPIGISPRDALGALSGELVARTAAGSPAHGAIEIGLAKPDLIAPLVARSCPAIPQLLPGATAKVDGGHCRGTLAPPPGDLGATTLRFLGGVPFDLSVDGKALVISLGPSGKGAVAPATTSVGDELRDGDWDLAWWGDGFLPPALMMEIARSMPSDPTTTDVMWLYMHLRTLGVGVRLAPHSADLVISASTQWANPDDVSLALEPLYAQAIAGKDVTAALAALGTQHPASPLGQSLHNGVAGLVPITAVVGIVAAVAIPAFLKYQRRSRAAAAAPF